MIPNQTITSTCFQWCQQQTTIFQNNQHIESLYILFFAVTSLFTHMLIEKFKHKLIKHHPSQNIERALTFTHYLSLTLILFYIIKAM